MSSSLEILASETQGDKAVEVFYLKGELDSSTYKTVEAKAEEVINAGTTNIVFDLHGVSYMGSAGLRALSSVSNSLKDKGGAMKLVNPSEAAAKIMKTLGFDSYFDICDDVQSAVDSL